MTLEPSTVNVLLGCIVGLQAWILKELVSLKVKIGVLNAQCPYCQAERKKETQEA